MPFQLSGLARDVHLALVVVDVVLLEGVLQVAHQSGEVWNKEQTTVLKSNFIQTLNLNFFPPIVIHLIYFCPHHQFVHPLVQGRCLFLPWFLIRFKNDCPNQAKCSCYLGAL